MKSRGFDLSIGRPILSLFVVVQLIILSSLIVLFLNVTLSFYTSVSTHSSSSSSSSSYSTSSSNFFDELKISASSSSNYSNSIIPSPIYQSNSNTLQGSDPTTPSPQSSLLLQSSSPPLPSTLSSLNSIESQSRWTSPPINQNVSSYYNWSSSNSSSSSSTPDSSTAISQRAITRKRLSKGCDLSKGEWVRDPNAPYYTNSTCWTIQEHQNCMKYGKPNLDFLKWRWKPNGCELPLLDPAQFLEQMRGKILAFIGDSLARNQMQSLMCLLSRVEYPKEISSPSEENLMRMFYQNYNFTIWIFWSPFLVRAEQSNHSIYNILVWNLYLDEPDPLWPPHLPNFDYLVLNTGNWYTRPALFHFNRTLVGCHYCPIPNAPFMSMRRAHRRAFRTALNAVAGAKWYGFKGMTIVRTVSPAHFEGGEWNKGGDCVRTGPFQRREAPRLERLENEMYKEQLKEFWKAKWEGSERGLEFRLLDTTEAMLMRPDGHPSKYGHRPNETWVISNDCVHWCLPGPVDMWNDFLFHIIII